MTDFPINPPLPEETLNLRNSLPQKPDPVTLHGRKITLRPADPDRDAGPLHEFTNGTAISYQGRLVEPYDADALVWHYMLGGPFETAEGMHAYLNRLSADPRSLCLIAEDNLTGRQIGIACYINNYPEHLKTELGSISYSPVAQRTGANTEATYLMLKHGFEIGFRRIEWKCDALNARSRHSALRMGFQFEGIQQNHFIVKDHSRDTAWFRILDTEWPSARAHLEALMERQ